MTALSARLLKVASALAVGGCLAAFPAFASTYDVQFATKVIIMASLAVGLNLAVGFAGLVSLCHAAFFGLGGYTLALAAPKYEAASLWTTLPLALAVSGGAAFVIGALSLRTRGVYFIMVTLAFGQMLFSLFHDTEIGGGSDGAFIYVKPTPGIPGVDLENPRTFYFAALVGFAVTLLVCLQAVRSPFGAALTAARDNERRARSLGFPVYRLRLTAFCLSGTLAGMAGYFAAAQYGFVAPELLGWHLSATALAMVVLGGMDTVAAPALGAAALLGLEEGLKAWISEWKLVEGLAIIALVIAFPKGVRQLAGRLFPEDGLPRPARTRTAEAPARKTEHAR